MGTVADAATVISVDVPWSDIIGGGPIYRGGIFYESKQAGHSRLDFSGTGRIEGLPGYLGTAAYLFAEFAGGLDEFFDTVTTDMAFIATDGLSFDLGYLAAGVDFAAAIITLGGDATLTLSRDDDQPAPIPLPATLPLLAAALGAAGLVARRRKDA